MALTGYGQDEDRRTAFEAGFNQHLVKPISIDALEQLLEGVPAGNGEPATVAGGDQTIIAGGQQTTLPGGDQNTLADGEPAK